ncbi:MAG: DNA repair exonuclease [Clostridiales bacterium]|nr:DNA repair exonuclease [Clostridiales bacterium]
MRILHAADLHLDSAFAGLAEEKAALLRQESRDILRRMVDWANDHAVDVMLLSGDLFDSDRMYSQTARTLAQALARFRGRIFLSPGNHDFYAPGSGYDAVDWPENVHIFTSRRPQTVLLRSLNASVTGAAFTSAEEWEPFDGASFSGGDASIRLGVLHGEVTRGESKYRAIPPAEIEKTNLTYLALGHVHRCAGVQRAGNTAYAYPGCLPGRGFDETGDKGFLYGEITPEKVELEFIPFAPRRYQSVTADITDRDPADAVRQALDPDCGQDICRVLLTGSRRENFSLSALTSELSGLCAALELTDETYPEEDVWARCGEDSLRGLFLQNLRARYDGADEDEKRQLLQAARFGLAALDNRDL